MQVVAEPITNLRHVQRAASITAHGAEVRSGIGAWCRTEHSPLRAYIWWVELTTEPRNQLPLSLERGSVAAPALAWVAGAAILATMATKADPVAATFVAVAVCSIGVPYSALSASMRTSKRESMCGHQSSLRWNS